MPAATSCEIGTALNNMTTLAALDIPAPNADFQDFAARVKLASGRVRGVGLPVVSWHYGYLTTAQWDYFKSYCNEASADIFIATPNNDGDYVRFEGVMIMPEKYAIRYKDTADWRYQDVTIIFTNLREAE